MCFCRFASGGSASTDLYCKNEKDVQTHVQNRLFCLTLQITRTQGLFLFLFEHHFLGTAPDPAKMEHELRLATYQQRAGGQDDGSLNKLLQIRHMANIWHRVFI